MKVAKAKGHLRGKQPKLSRRQEAHLASLVRSDEYSTAEVAELFGVARSTVYRAIERDRGRAGADAQVVVTASRPAAHAGVPHGTPPSGRRLRPPHTRPRCSVCGSACGRAPAQRSAGLEVLTDGAADHFRDAHVLFGGP
jgi:hypothetical protein